MIHALMHVLGNCHGEWNIALMAVFDFFPILRVYFIYFWGRWYAAP